MVILGTSLRNAFFLNAWSDEHVISLAPDIHLLHGYTLPYVHNPQADQKTIKTIMMPNGNVTVKVTLSILEDIHVVPQILLRSQSIISMDGFF
jgi:hypothetical protein